MPTGSSMPPPESDPGDIITNRDLRELYRDFISSIRSLHPDVRLEVSQMEIWARFDDLVLARVVPYRELFHVQVGQDNVWEIRVRNQSACLDTLDRILSRFLEIFARRAAKRPA